MIEQVQEKKIKKISEMNIDPSKTPGQPSSSSPPPIVANGVHADPAHDYLSKFSFPPGGLPSLRLPVVIIRNIILKFLVLGF